jgi:hypothetical protein
MKNLTSVSADRRSTLTRTISAPHRQCGPASEPGSIKRSIMTHQPKMLGNLKRNITRQMTELSETPSLIIIFNDLTASQPTQRGGRGI